MLKGACLIALALMITGLTACVKGSSASSGCEKSASLSRRVAAALGPLRTEVGRTEDALRRISLEGSSVRTRELVRAAKGAGIDEVLSRTVSDLHATIDDAEKWLAAESEQSCAQFVGPWRELLAPLRSAVAAYETLGAALADKQLDLPSILTAFEVATVRSDRLAQAVSGLVSVLKGPLADGGDSWVPEATEEPAEFDVVLGVERPSPSMPRVCRGDQRVAHYSAIRDELNHCTNERGLDFDCGSETYCLMSGKDAAVDVYAVYWTGRPGEKTPVLVGIWVDVSHPSPDFRATFSRKYGRVWELRDVTSAPPNWHLGLIAGRWCQKGGQKGECEEVRWLSDTLGFTGVFPRAVTQLLSADAMRADAAEQQAIRREKAKLDQMK